MAAAVLSNINISVSESFSMASRKAHKQHQQVTSQPGPSSRLNQPSSPSQISSTSATSQDATTRPKTFKRIRSTLEQSLRIPTLSKSKSPVPPDPNDELARSSDKHVRSKHRSKSRERERSADKPTEAPSKDKPSKSTVFRRVTFSKPRDTASPPPEGPAEDSKARRGERVAGFTSFITPSLRQASISTPALHLSSQALPSPKSQSAAFASSSSTADVLTSPTRERPQRVHHISGPSPLTSRREGRSSSSHVPPSLAREPSRHRSSKSVPIVNLASSPTTLSFREPSTPTRLADSRPNSPNPASPSPTPRGRVGGSRRATQSSGHLPLGDEPSTPVRPGTSALRPRSPSRRVVTPTSPRGLTSSSATHLPLTSTGGSGVTRIRRPSVDETLKPALEKPRRPSVDGGRRDSPRRTSFDLGSRPSDLARRPSGAASPVDPRPSSPIRPRAQSPTQRTYFQNRHFNISSSSISSPANLENRELLRTATTLICKEMQRASSWNRNDKDVEDVELRLRPLLRLERVWGKSAGAANSSSNLHISNQNTLLTSGGEERERRVFSEALRDGYVLCQLMNKLRSKSVVKPDPREDGLTRTSNITKFLAACSSFGLASEDLFQRDDLLEASNESLARVAHTIVALFDFVSMPTPDRSRVLTGQGNKSNGSGGPYSHAVSRAAMSTPNLSSPPSSPARKRWSPSSGLPTVRSDSPNESSGESFHDVEETEVNRGVSLEAKVNIPTPTIMTPPPKSPLRSRPRPSQDWLDSRPSSPPLSSSPPRQSVADSMLAVAGTSIRDSIGDSIRQSIASSAMTDLTTYSSLLEPTKRTVSGTSGNNRFGTIRTITTDATSECPSVSRADGSSLAASLADEFGFGQRKQSELSLHSKRERRLSESAHDLVRVVEESEDNGTRRRPTKTPSSPRHDKQAVFLGKGKWPDDFMDAMPPPKTTSPAAIPSSSITPDLSGSPSSSTPPSSSGPRKLAIVGASRRNENGEPLHQFPRRPSHRATRNSLDSTGSSLLPKESVIRREASPDGLPVSSGPKVIIRRHSTKPSGRNGYRNEASSREVSPVPFPQAESSNGSPTREDAEERPRLIRGRFKSEVDGESTRRKPRPSSYDELGARPPMRSRFESMVNLGVTSNEKASDIILDGSAARKTLIVREEGKVSTHYQLGNAIGRGQFGTVYRALNLNTGQMVAIKRIPVDGLKEEEITQLMKEVELVKSLSHPSIVKYEGMARDQDTLSIVLEYAENGSLGQTLKAFGKLNEKLVASYVVKILEGLHYLHQSDVVHCDLKAANILTTKNGNVKLSDFGVSLNMRAMERQQNNVAGTPNWMAPEVIELKGASPKSDVWSLGCTVVELLTGRPPYADLGGNTMSVMYAIVEDEKPPIPEGLSPLLEDFLLQCFNKDPDLRPDAETLCEHAWLRNNWVGTKELRPQDSIPFLRRVSADYQKSSDAIRYLSQLGENDGPEEQPISSSPPKHRHSASAQPRNPNSDSDISPKDHNFVKTTFSKPMTCRVCFLHVKKHAVLCAHCSLIAHSKCATNAPPTCDLRAQLLLYARYAEKGNPSSAYNNPIDAISEALPKSPASDVAYIAGSPRTSIDGQSTTAMSPPSSVHPPTAFKFMGAFKRSRSNLTGDSQASSAASTPSPVVERSPPLVPSKKLRKVPSDRPPSVVSTGTQDSSLRSTATARESFSSKKGTGHKSLHSLSEKVQRASNAVGTSASHTDTAVDEERIPGALPQDTRRHKRHRDSKGSSGNCTVQ